MKRLAMVLVVVSVSLHVTLIIPQAEAAEFRYSVAPLNIPFSAGYYSPNIMDMNANRQIVGSVSYDAALFDTHSAAFFWEAGMAAATIIEPLDRSVGYAGATAINASGQSVVNQDIGGNSANVIRTNANFTNPQILATNLYGGGTDINSSGVVVGVGSWPSLATIWPSPGATPITLPRLPAFPTTPLPTRCFSNNDIGEVIGLAYKTTTDIYGTHNESTGFFYTIANGAMRELTSVSTDRRAYPVSINNNGLVVGSSTSKTGDFIYDEPTYWDIGGAPHALRDNIPITFKDGYLYDIDDNDNMYITTYNLHASTDFDVWVYNPAWGTEMAKKVDDLIPADSGYHVNYATAASPNGLLLCSARDASDNSFQLLLTPYDVDTSDLGAGIGASTTLLGGITQPGGVGATFSEVIGAGEMVAHYGSESSGSFALQFLPDPADMDDVADMIPGDEAQHWLVDFEGGTFTGPVTLTFCYDGSLLPAGFDENQLVLLHYVDGVWETIVPSDINTIANTITFNTDSFSPFVLGTPVPEPCSAMLLTIATAGLLRRRRRRR